jgi:hypothetical protein
VIETSTVAFEAESDQLHVLPELGALVRVGSRDDRLSCFGVVAFGSTGGLDASRHAVRRGGDDLADEAIYARHPELELILRTVFQVALVGYRDGDIYRHALPALPAPLHYSVFACNIAEIDAFCRQPRYLGSLLNYRGDVSPEQLVAAHLRWVDVRLNDRQEWLLAATRRLAHLMKRDYDGLVSILELVAPD